MTEDQLRQIVRGELQPVLAQLELDVKDEPRESVVVRYLLDTAVSEFNPKFVGFNFRQAVIIDASDANATVSFKSSRDETNDAIPMKQNSRIRSAKLYTKEANIYWEAQSGKWVDILYIVRGEFDSGRNLSINGGGVSLNDGSSFSNSLISLSAATATEIASSNLNRKVSYIQNHTGADLYYGDSSVTNSNKYSKVAAGGMIEWRNTTTLYGYSVAGGDVSEEEHE